jgi:hypothetical protein
VFPSSRQPQSAVRRQHRRASLAALWPTIPPHNVENWQAGIPFFACTRSVSRGRSWKLCSDHSGRSFAVLHRRHRGRGVCAAEEAKAARSHAGGPRALLRGNAGCSSVTGRATCQRVELRCTHRLVLRFRAEDGRANHAEEPDEGAAEGAGRQCRCFRGSHCQCLRARVWVRVSSLCAFTCLRPSPDPSESDSISFPFPRRHRDGHVLSRSCHSCFFDLRPAGELTASRN